MDHASSSYSEPSYDPTFVYTFAFVHQTEKYLEINVKSQNLEMGLGFDVKHDAIAPCFRIVKRCERETEAVVGAVHRA